MKKHLPSLRFLIIEDVKEHEELIIEAVLAHDFLHDIRSAKNCGKALDSLHKDVSEDYLPHIIILDLNVGGMNALEFLSTISVDEKLASIPVVALTPEANEAERTFVTNMKNCVYIVKPAGILEFMELVNFICNFWSEHKSVPDYQSIKKRIT